MGKSYGFIEITAALTAAVTADTSPCTIRVTSRPPSLRSHDASSTSAVLHMMSRALIAATTHVIPRPHTDVEKILPKL